MTTHHKQTLEQEKAVLMDQLAGLGKRDPKSLTWEATAETADPANADPNSQADRFEDFEEKSALIIPLEARLTEIEGALARIESGNYGTCRVCGAEIEEARLAANPSAETCMTHIEA